MIQIKELGPQDVGKWVEYRGGAGETERGRIKSWNDKYVRVGQHRLPISVLFEIVSIQNGNTLRIDRLLESLHNSRVERESTILTFGN